MEEERNNLVEEVIDHLDKQLDEWYKTLEIKEEKIQLKSRNFQHPKYTLKLTQINRESKDYVEMVKTSAGVESV